MLHVLRHYLPVRKALLILSETALLTLIAALGMAAHLWPYLAGWGSEPSDAVRVALAIDGLSLQDAFWHCVGSSLVVSVICQVAMGFNELYDFRVSSSSYERSARFLGSAASAILLTLLLLALVPLWGAERLLAFPGLPLTQRIVLLTITLSLGFVLLHFWRNLFHAGLRRSRFQERILILGRGRLAERLQAELATRRDTGYQVVATVLLAPALERRAGERRGRRQDEPEGGGGTGNPWFESVERGRSDPAFEPASQIVTLADPAYSPRAEEPAGAQRESLRDLAVRLRVDDVIVALEDRRGALPTDELLACRMEGIVVQEGETFYERLAGRIPAEAMRPSYLIFNPGFVQQPLARVVKRCTDTLLALIGLALAWPAMVLVAIAVRLDSPGPVLFRQERVGKSARTFTLMKFRSMRADAEKLTGPVWAQADDPRITRVGRFIRKTRLDELPQLFNVVAGSMSLVGPRPERPTFVAELESKVPYWRQRHIVRPGLTGWAQINYPYGNTLEDALQKLQYDLFYIKYQSFVFDLSILFNTVKTVLLSKGT
jgi:lipopolysaccharide/colanic/teichoic acid biosynthesis glycosyltransferase